MSGFFSRMWVISTFYISWFFHYFYNKDIIFLFLINVNSSVKDAVSAWTIPKPSCELELLSFNIYPQDPGLLSTVTMARVMPLLCLRTSKGSYQGRRPPSLAFNSLLDLVPAFPATFPTVPLTPLYQCFPTMDCCALVSHDINLVTSIKKIK